MPHKVYADHKVYTEKVLHDLCFNYILKSCKNRYTEKSWSTKSLYWIFANSQTSEFFWKYSRVGRQNSEVWLFSLYYIQKFSELYTASKIQKFGYSVIQFGYFEMLYSSINFWILQNSQTENMTEMQYFAYFILNVMHTSEKFLQIQYTEKSWSTKRRCKLRSEIEA